MMGISFETPDQIFGAVVVAIFALALIVAAIRNVFLPRRSEIELQVARGLAVYSRDVSATLLALALAGVAIGSIDEVAFDWATNGRTLIAMSMVGLVTSVVLSYLTRRASNP